MDNQTPQQPQTPASIAPELPPQQQPAIPAKKLPVLGFVGLGLAVIGTILACIPAIFVIGVLVLITAFVVSLVALFKKDTAKWPSIVGLAVSVIGGLVASVVFIVALAGSLSENANQTPSANTPSSSVEQQTESTETDTTSKRPSIDEISEKIPVLSAEDGITGYENIPNFYPCVSKELYNSDLSDESLQLIIDGEDPLDSERTLGREAIGDAVSTCERQ